MHGLSHSCTHIKTCQHGDVHGKRISGRNIYFSKTYLAIYIIPYTEPEKALNISYMQLLAWLLLQLYVSNRHLIKTISFNPPSSLIQRGSTLPTVSLVY